MSEEIVSLRRDIDADQRELERLSAAEAELLDHIERRDYTAATKREVLMSERHTIEERLRRNRQILVSLGG